MKTSFQFNSLIKAYSFKKAIFKMDFCQQNMILKVLDPLFYIEICTTKTQRKIKQSRRRKIISISIPTSWHRE